MNGSVLAALAWDSYGLRGHELRFSHCFDISDIAIIWSDICILLLWTIFKYDLYLSSRYRQANWFVILAKNYFLNFVGLYVWQLTWSVSPPVQCPECCSHSFTLITHTNKQLLPHKALPGSLGAISSSTLCPRTLPLPRTWTANPPIIDRPTRPTEPQPACKWLVL